MAARDVRSEAVLGGSGADATSRRLPPGAVDVHAVMHPDPHACFHVGDCCRTLGAWSKVAMPALARLQATAARTAPAGRAASSSTRAPKRAAWTYGGLQAYQVSTGVVDTARPAT